MMVSLRYSSTNTSASTLKNDHTNGMNNGDDHHRIVVQKTSDMVPEEKLQECGVPTETFSKVIPLESIFAPQTIQRDHVPTCCNSDVETSSEGSCPQLSSFPVSVTFYDSFNNSFHQKFICNNQSNCPRYRINTNHAIRNPIPVPPTGTIVLSFPVEDQQVYVEGSFRLDMPPKQQTCNLFLTGKDFRGKAKIEIQYCRERNLWALSQLFLDTVTSRASFSGELEGNDRELLQQDTKVSCNINNSGSTQHQIETPEFPTYSECFMPGMQLSPVPTNMSMYPMEVAYSADLYGGMSPYGQYVTPMPIQYFIPVVPYHSVMEEVTQAESSSATSYVLQEVYDFALSNSLANALIRGGSDADWLRIRIEEQLSCAERDPANEEAQEFRQWFLSEIFPDLPTMLLAHETSRLVFVLLRASPEADQCLILNQLDVLIHVALHDGVLLTHSFVSIVNSFGPVVLRLFLALLIENSRDTYELLFSTKGVRWVTDLVTRSHEVLGEKAEILERFLKHILRESVILTICCNKLSSVFVLRALELFPWLHDHLAGLLISARCTTLLCYHSVGAPILESIMKHGRAFVKPTTWKAVITPIAQRRMFDMARHPISSTFVSLLFSYEEYKSEVVHQLLEIPGSDTTQIVTLFQNPSSSLLLRDMLSERPMEEILYFTKRLMPHSNSLPSGLQLEWNRFMDGLTDANENCVAP